jgi:XTP/dITP diphosphohydrolase
MLSTWFDALFYGNGNGSIILDDGAKAKRVASWPACVIVPPMTAKLLIATHNPGKLREFGHLLAGLPFTLIGPDELGLALHVQESGATYAENAGLKALAYAQAADLLALADDSGLEVDALGGAPGVRSARYTRGGDTDRVTALLRALRQAGVPEGDRIARFRCVIVVAAPDGRTWSAEGVCPGRIVDTPRGSGGFGYDPIFYLPSYGRTMAELPPEEKNRISHRARAAQAIRPLLTKLYDAQSVT